MESWERDRFLTCFVEDVTKELLDFVSEMADYTLNKISGEDLDYSFLLSLELLLSSTILLFLLRQFTAELLLCLDCFFLYMLVLLSE